jgi:hypothetical protein
MRIDPVHVQISSLQSASSAGSANRGGSFGTSFPSQPAAVSVALSTNLHGLIEQAIQLHESMVMQSPTVQAKAMVQAGAGLSEDQLDALTAALLQDWV